MKLKVNKSLRFSLADELEKAVFRSGKGIQEILQTIAVTYPEITFSEAEWYEISPVIRDKIIMRISRTLNAIS